MLGGIFRSIVLLIAVVVLTYSYITDKSVKAMVADIAPQVVIAINKSAEVAADVVEEVPGVVDDAVTSTKETIHKATE